MRTLFEALYQNTHIVVGNWVYGGGGRAFKGGKYAGGNVSKWLETTSNYGFFR